MATVFLAAGGTGGHVIPALACAKVLHAQGKRVVWLGTNGHIDQTLLADCKWDRITLPLVGFRGGSLFKKLSFGIGLLRSLWSVAAAYLYYRPDYVIATGGYASFPTAILSPIFNVPLALCEQNAVAGWTNRALVKIASVVCTAYPNVHGLEAYRKISCFLGNPMLVSSIKESCAETVQSKIFTILIVGGSQGARVFNTVIPEVIAGLQIGDAKIRVVHQCGGSIERRETLMEQYKAIGIEVEVFLFSKSMHEYYAKASCIIARSGALTVSEVCCFGVPAIYVPLKAAVDNHQFYNALYPKQQGAAWIVPEGHLLTKRFAYMRGCIERLVSDSDHASFMRRAALRLGKPHAAEQFVSRILLGGKAEKSSCSC